MSNVPTIQLPSHLAALAGNQQLMAINQSASHGISAGGWPRISIKGSRFRLQNPQGEEVVVPELHLDVIIVDANPHGLSKIYYSGTYDPNTDEKAPDCYSDNGVGPSIRAAKPQCGTCAACPHNVWGSKITPSGAQTKACSDLKKVAVLIANNPDGPVFELRVPPASLKNFATYINSLNGRGIPAAGIVTRLTFDTAADFPRLVFTASGWATEEQAKAVLEVIGTDEVDVCTGKNDKPVDASKALPAPVQAGAVPPPVPVSALMPQKLQEFNLPPPAAAAPPLAGAAPLPAEPAKRTRKKKAELAPPFPEPVTPPFLKDMPPPNNATTVAPASAPVTDAALDALINQAMGT